MRRRAFVRIATVASAALYVPDFGCHTNEDSFAKVLAQPTVLQRVCDENTIHRIGEAYLQQWGNEKEKAELIRLLTGADHREVDASTGTAAVASYLNKRVQLDFAQDRTIIVDGWVLSVTEARQCALLSLLQK